MCFSANASFTSAVILTGIGVACVKLTFSNKQIFLAVIPFGFALQQVLEGFVWLNFNNSSHAGWQPFLVSSFLIFSHIIWPIYIPFSIYFLEKNLKRKPALKILLALGLILSTYHIYSLLMFSVSASVNQHHIRYTIGHPDLLLIPGSIIYGVATIIPAFISTVPRMWWMGVFIFVSYLFTYLFYRSYSISVWCFVATAMCVIIYLILLRSRRLSILQN